MSNERVRHVLDEKKNANQAENPAEPSIADLGGPLPLARSTGPNRGTGDDRGDPGMGLFRPDPAAPAGSAESKQEINSKEETREAPRPHRGK